MKVCANCFNDKEIKAFIDSEGIESGSGCDVCGDSSQSKTINFDELSDFFTEFLTLFVKDKNGNKSLVQFIQSEFNMFSSDCCAEKILQEILSHDTNDLSVYDKVSYSLEVSDYFSIWEKLKNEIKTQKRYFVNFDSYNLTNYLVPQASIKQGNVLYRARITPLGKMLNKEDMGAPPAEKAQAGRANPLGIPYLYLSNDIDTTYYEVRAVYLDKISVGTFRVVRDLRVVDFSEEFNLFWAYTNTDLSLSDLMRRGIVLDCIRHDLSKPLRRFDTELEYVPTQLICEHCKINGADGVRFNSSLHQGGVNIVLFSSQDAECIDVQEREIHRVMITDDLESVKPFV